MIPGFVTIYIDKDNYKHLYFYPGIDNDDQFIYHNIDWSDSTLKMDSIYNEDGSIDYEKTNLEWCSHRYNNGYGTKGLRSSQNLINNPLISRPIYQISKSGEIINEFPSISEAARAMNCQQSIINRVCRYNANKSVYTHRQYTSCGYIWKYKENI
jgi:hypothetical protein